MEKFTFKEYKQLLTDKLNQYYDRINLGNDITELEKMMNQKVDNGEQNPII